MKKILFTIFMASSMLFSSCEAFLTVEPQDTIMAENYYVSKSAIRANTAVLYSSKTWFDFHANFMFYAGDMMAGDMYYTYDQEGHYYYNSVTPTNSYLRNGWVGLFRVVSFCNSVINDMPDAARGNGVDESVINGALGEAYTIRAMAYLFLTEYWGEVPIIENATELITSGNPDDIYVNKNTQNSLYRFMIRDLERAIPLLPESDDPGRATKWSAMGLLAKVQLQYAAYAMNATTTVSASELYEAAKTNAKNAIDGAEANGYGLYPDYSAMFDVSGNNCSESLLSIQCRSGNYGEGNAPAFRNLGEHNQGYQEMMRRYLKGDEGCVSGFTYYLRRNPATHGVINYFADHDGFTMADMVSYERKHNMSNGDDNTDGTSSNYSWNCGAEGVTRKKAVHHLRMQQLKNAFLMLLTSQGTPMIYGGDEFLNSQKGNNNAWCQDNRTGWVNWNNGKEGRELLEFVKQLIRFRKEHPVLHTPKEMRLMDYQGAGCPDLSYHSQRAWFSQMENTCRFIGVMYCGDYAVKENGEPDDYLYLGFNMHWNPHELALPSLPKEHVWYRAVDTSREECFAEERAEIVEGKSITVPPRSIVILIGRQA